MRIILIHILFILVLSTASAFGRSLVIVCDNYPPYQVVTPAGVGGFSTRIIKSILQDMGVKVASLDIYPWQRALTILKDGEADALFSANFTDERTAYAVYPEEPLVHSSWVVWVRKKDTISFHSFDDLNNGMIGVVRGYSYTPEFWDYLHKQGNYEETTDDDTNFRKLSAGRIDYVVAEIGNGYQILKDLKLEQIVPLTGHPIKTDGLYLIFNKNTVPQSLVNEFSIRLSQFRKSEDYRELSREYLGR